MSRQRLDKWAGVMAQLKPDLPGEYAEALTTLKSFVLYAQKRAQRFVNTTMIELYWNIGRTILEGRRTSPGKQNTRLARTSPAGRVAAHERAGRSASLINPRLVTQSIPILSGSDADSAYNMRASTNSEQSMPSRDMAQGP